MPEYKGPFSKDAIISEGHIVPLKIQYGVHGDLTIVYPKPYSIHLRGTIQPRFSCIDDVGINVDLKIQVLKNTISSESL